MRRSGLLVWKVLSELEAMVQEGIRTLDLEQAAEKMIRDAGARPAFKGYYVPAVGATYPFVLCTSVNEEVVHGMPSAKRALKKGDIVSIDTGASLDGYFGDSAITVAVGEVDENDPAVDAGDAGIAGVGDRPDAPGQPAFRRLRRG